jgi:CelD/BcsL family acetyltransferase involved in cellulose biosynthesis
MSAGNVMFRTDSATDNAYGEDSTCAPARAARQITSPQAVAEAAELPLLASPPLAAARDPGGKTAPRSGIALRLHHDLEEIGEEWRSFQGKAEHTVFQSFDWLAHWQRHVGAPRGTLPAVVVGHELDGEILFILPFAIETASLIPRLTWLGAQMCDYNAPILADHFSARVSAARFFAIWREVIDLLQAQARSRFDLIDLQKMPECVGEQRNPFMDLNVRAHPSGAYVADLGSDWEGLYAAKRSGATRKRERRQLRQLAEHGKLCFVDVDEPAERTRTLTTLIEQKSRAFARMGVDNLFLKPGRRELFLALASDPAMRGLIHVSRLDVGEHIAAVGVGLKFRNCYYLILSSYDDGEIARFGPGRAHLHELLRHAIEQGYRQFDFTVGDEPYKRDWADSELKLHDYLQAGSTRGELLGLAVGQFRRLKRMIKQSPALWRTFSKARALAVSLTASRP